MTKWNEPPDKGDWLLGFFIFAVIVFCMFSYAWPHDAGQWQDIDPAVSAWFRELKMPDIPTASCCGEADAYWCDDYHYKDGKAYCTIDDDRDDVKLMRAPMPVGTEIEIPDYKLKWDRGNPTGHAIVFLSRAKYVYCYVQGGGT